MVKNPRAIERLEREDERISICVVKSKIKKNIRIEIPVTDMVMRRQEWWSRLIEI